MAAFLFTLTRTNWLNFSAQSRGGTLSGSGFLRVKKDVLVWLLLFFQSTIGRNCLVVKTAWKKASFMGREVYSSSHHQRAVSIPLSIILLSALDVRLCPQDRSLFSPCVCVHVCGLSLETQVWAVVLYVSPAIIWQLVHLLWPMVTKLNVGWCLGKRNYI